MFSVIREKVSILEVAEKLMPVGLKQVGEAWAPEDEVCVFCGHSDCLRFKDDGPDSMFRCFSGSCDKSGDVTRFVALMKNISDSEAAIWIAKEFNLQLPNDYSPIQQVFELAAIYYHNCLTEANRQVELGGVTPSEYQIQRRGHTLGSITKFKIGWSDGGLCRYLSSVGIPDEIIKDSGLLAKNGKSDFLPRNCFIYPHFVRNRCSHFTFKDPLKRVEYQVPNKYKLNGHVWYNSDSLRKEGPVILVEGENDLISVDEAGWNSPIICCNGSISKQQLDWLHENVKNREVVTIFDTDAAGDTYREKVGRIHGFKSTKHVKLTSGQKDIDEFLKAGGKLGAALAFAEEETSERKATDKHGNEVEEFVEAGPQTGIVEREGAYFRVKYKEGQQYYQRLSDFTIDLRNVFIRGDFREREVVVKRFDGVTSKPIRIPSEAKVSIKPFKVLVCDAIDGTYYGKEEDLADIWKFVYSQGNERIVILPEMMGRVDQYDGWIFGENFYHDSGVVLPLNKDNIFWFEQDKLGVKPMSISTTGSQTAGLPFLVNELEESEVETMLRGFIQQLGNNFGGKFGLGNAITSVGFMWSCVYSNIIFERNRSFPFLMLWGRGGRGKTTILKWLLEFFGMSELGWTTVSNLNSGVGWGRKMAYYSSLPMCIDELRTDKETKDLYPTFRGYFDRASRNTGTNKDNLQVNERFVRACMLFGGQDQFDDDATRQRCIPIRVSSNEKERDIKVSYDWIDARKPELPAIGDYWIRRFNQFSASDVISGVRELEDRMRAIGISPRTARNWSVAGFFGQKLVNAYFPKFDYIAYLVEAVKEDVSKQKEDDMITNFLEVVEGLQVNSREILTGDHIRVEGNKLYMWFAEIFRIIQRENLKSDNPFSKRAILEEFREENYFLGDDIVPMGMSETRRRVIVFDLTTAPEIVQNIGKYSAQ